MARIPDAFIDDLLARTDIVEVIGSRLPLKRQGKEHLIETVGKELRGMMSWIDEGGLDIDV